MALARHVHSELCHRPLDQPPRVDADHAYRRRATAAVTFDKALAINSMQVWSEPVGALREMRRVMKTGSRGAWVYPLFGTAEGGINLNPGVASRRTGNLRTSLQR